MFAGVMSCRKGDDKCAVAWLSAEEGGGGERGGTAVEAGVPVAVVEASEMGSNASELLI